MKQLPDISKCDELADIEESNFETSTDAEQSCYCSELGIYNIFTNSDNYNYCKTFAWEQMLRYLINITVSITISLINTILRILLRILAKFERYKNKTAMYEGMMSKLFLALFINMGVLIIITNADLSGFEFI